MADASAPTYRHTPAIFPYRLADGKRGESEGKDGRDTNTTNAGSGQANLVRPLATATVCSVPGLRTGAGLNSEPGGPGSPGRVQLTAAPEGTEVEAHDLKGSSLELGTYFLTHLAATFHRHDWPTRPRNMMDGGNVLR
jgi:hypothetical protein